MPIDTPCFACGLNPPLPAGLPAACKREEGNWTFVDFTQMTPDCPFGFGYFVAFYRESCSKFDRVFRFFQAGGCHSTSGTGRMKSGCLG